MPIRCMYLAVAREHSVSWVVIGPTTWIRANDTATITNLNIAATGVIFALLDKVTIYYGNNE